MTAHIALLRGVNVGGNKMVAMADLRRLLTDLGFADARSCLQSGNLVFNTGDRPDDELERVLEGAAAARLDCHTDFFVRTTKEWRAMVAANPFEREAERDPARLVVMVLKRAPAPEAVENLRAAISGPEIVHVAGREAYLAYPAGTGKSRLTNALIDRKLGVRGTGRNWNTVQKLAAMVAA